MASAATAVAEEPGTELENLTLAPDAIAQMHGKAGVELENLNLTLSADVIAELHEEAEEEASEEAQGETNEEETHAHLTDPALPATELAANASNETDGSDSDQSLESKDRWQCPMNFVQTAIALVGLVIVLYMFRPQLEDHDLSKWTALKVFRDDCRAQLSLNRSMTSDCIKELSEPLPRPPVTLLKRLLKRHSLPRPATAGVVLPSFPVILLIFVVLTVIIYLLVKSPKRQDVVTKRPCVQPKATTYKAWVSSSLARVQYSSSTTSSDLFTSGHATIRSKLTLRTTKTSFSYSEVQQLACKTHDEYLRCLEQDRLLLGIDYSQDADAWVPVSRGDEAFDHLHQDDFGNDRHSESPAAPNLSNFIQQGPNDRFTSVASVRVTELIEDEPEDLRLPVETLEGVPYPRKWRSFPTLSSVARARRGTVSRERGKQATAEPTKIPPGSQIEDGTDTAALEGTSGTRAETFKRGLVEWLPLEELLPPRIRVMVSLDRPAETWTAFISLIIPRDISFQSLTDRVDAKLEAFTLNRGRKLASGTLRLKYRDEDGDLIWIDSDYAVREAILSWAETTSEESKRAMNRLGNPDTRTSDFENPDPWISLFVDRNQQVGLPAIAS